MERVDATAVRYHRSEEMKAWRRKVGDNGGGIKFQGKLMHLAPDRICNTISTVVCKDCLICEIYERDTDTPLPTRME